MAKGNENLIAYVPVIHSGYVDLFESHEGADMHVLNNDVLSEYPHLRKDIRALKPEQAKSLIESLGVFRKVSLLGRLSLENFSEEEIIMPDDDVSRDLVERYFTSAMVRLEPVFLRWDRRNSFVNTDVTPDRTIQSNEINENIVRQIYEEANKSSDWWRRVGAALVNEDGDIMTSGYNHHLPSEYTPWVDGDPRNNAHRGVALEASTVQHAEASLIAQAAKEGRAVNGASVFVTTFPCPACAKLIAESGINACYFTEGYAMTDGLQIMKGFNVEIVKVEGFKEERVERVYRPYPEK